MTQNSKPTKKTPWIKTHYDWVAVQWDDAAGLRHGWMDKAEKPKPQLALTLGFLIVDTPEHIIIAGDTDEDGGHNGRTQIPRGMIRKVRVIHKKDVQPVAAPEAKPVV